MQSLFEGIQGVVFDKDGTLFDFNATWSAWCDRLVHELSAGDGPLETELAEIIGYNKVTRTFTSGSLIVSGAADDTAKALADRLPEFSFEQINEIGNKHLHDLPLEQVTDLNALLNALKVFGLKLGVATNDSEASAVSQLKQCNIHHHFDFICGYDSGFGSKPAAGMLAAFCAATGLSADSVAMVGDSLHDLNAGGSAGVKVKVGVLTGPAQESELSEVADIVLSDISELMELLPPPG